MRCMERKKKSEKERSVQEPQDNIKQLNGITKGEGRGNLANEICEEIMVKNYLRIMTYSITKHVNQIAQNER